MNSTEIMLARAGESSEPKADAAVRFAVQVAEERGHVSDAVLSVVRQAGFDDAQIVEIVAHVVASCFTNFFNAVAQPEIDYPPVNTVN